MPSTDQSTNGRLINTITMIIKTQHRNINSKPIFNYINENVVDAIDSVGPYWISDDHREALVSFIDDVLYELQEQGKIYNYKVYSDDRNNPKPLITEDTYVVTLEYRQAHCINVTHLSYVFQNDELTLIELG